MAPKKVGDKTKAGDETNQTKATSSNAAASTSAADSTERSIPATGSEFLLPHAHQQQGTNPGTLSRGGGARDTSSTFPSDTSQTKSSSFTVDGKHILNSLSPAFVAANQHLQSSESYERSLSQESQTNVQLSIEHEGGSKAPQTVAKSSKNQESSSFPHMPGTQKIFSSPTPPRDSSAHSCSAFPATGGGMIGALPLRSRSHSAAVGTEASLSTSGNDDKGKEKVDEVPPGHSTRYEPHQSAAFHRSQCPSPEPSHSSPIHEEGAPWPPKPREGIVQAGQRKAEYAYNMIPTYPDQKVWHCCNCLVYHREHAPDNGHPVECKFEDCGTPTGIRTGGKEKGNATARCKHQRCGGCPQQLAKHKKPYVPLRVRHRPWYNGSFPYTFWEWKTTDDYARAIGKAAPFEEVDS